MKTENQTPAKAAHTPGKWQVERHSKWLIKVEAYPHVICEVRSGSDKEDADARLIASAPDLLAACIALVDWDTYQANGHDKLIAACQAARAAIAKAGGAA